MSDDDITAVYEAQKAQSLREIAETLKQILIEMRQLRQMQLAGRR